MGDGANDELMIREAHCGLGIGIEPTADTKAFSDRQVELASHAKSSKAPLAANSRFVRLKALAFWLRFYSSSARAR